MGKAGVCKAGTLVSYFISHSLSLYNKRLITINKTWLYAWTWSSGLGLNLDFIHSIKLPFNYYHDNRLSIPRAKLDRRKWDSAVAAQVWLVDDKDILSVHEWAHLTFFFIWFFELCLHTHHVCLASSSSENHKVADLFERRSLKKKDRRVSLEKCHFWLNMDFLLQTSLLNFTWRV